MIFFTAELRRKDTDTGKPSEQSQIPDEQQFIDNCHTGHRIRTDPAHHNIIQHADKIRDAVLDHDRHGDRQRSFIKPFFCSQ